MAEETENTAAAAPAATNGSAPATPVLRPLGQYIRDLSFENILSTKGAQGEVKPDIKVEVSLNARKRGEEGNNFEVIGKFKIASTNKEGGETLFLLELEYAGIFTVANVADEQVHPFLMIEGPRLMFPYVRRLVADITAEGGFPPLNLEPIDFVALYRQGIAQRQAAQAAAAPGGSQPS